MLTDAQRKTFERRLLAAFAGAMASRSPELLRLLGSQPDVSHVPATFWAGLDRQLVAAIGPVITDMATTSALGLGASAGISSKVNWSLVNQRAASWSSRYTYQLVSGIDSTTRKMLQTEINRFFKDSAIDLKTLAGTIEQDIPELVTKLGQVVTSRARADMIAITEATRAAAEGEQALIDQIKQDNPRVLVVDVFLSSKDEHVCPKICIPLNGVRGDGRGNFKNPLDGKFYRIPAHVVCRCGRGVLISGL